MVRCVDSAFESAKIAWTCYGWLLREISAEVGWEKTLRMERRVGRTMGAAFAELLQGITGEKPLTPACLSAGLETIVKAMAFDYKIEADVNGVEAHFERCPVYSGLAAAGLQYGEIRAFCESCTTGECEGLQQAFPEATETVEFRDHPDHACVEVFALSR
jgi:hypothetical protein